jgi:hypothetical protein
MYKKVKLAAAPAAPLRVPGLNRNRESQFTKAITRD